jgi:hypothetical protein
LYADEVVDTINALNLSRYGLGNYIDNRKINHASKSEKEILQNLSRAGKRLMGFCRTNLFKRLESSGHVLLEWLQRHILRNYIFIYALENHLPLPIGTQDAALLDSRMNDEDVDRTDFFDVPTEDESVEVMIDNQAIGHTSNELRTEEDFQQRAQQIYQLYTQKFITRFDWLSSELFAPAQAKHLWEDARSLLAVLQKVGEWDWRKDAKLLNLWDLVANQHSGEKVLVFTQFADTVSYLEDCLRAKGV